MSLDAHQSADELLSKDSVDAGPRLVHRGRGRPKRQVTLTVTARMTGASYTAWQTLLAYADKHEKSKSAVAKMAVLSLLALHLPATPNGPLAEVIVLRSALVDLGREEGVPLWKCLGITPPFGAAPDHLPPPMSLLQIERSGEELAGGHETVSVRFSDDWALRWRTLERGLPRLLPGQILAEAIRVAAVVLGGEEDGRRVLIRLPDGHQEELRRFLGFEGSSTGPTAQPAKSPPGEVPKRPSHRRSA